MFNWFKKKKDSKPQITPEEANRRKLASEAAKRREQNNIEMQENVNSILTLLAEVKAELAEMKAEMAKEGK